MPLRVNDCLHTLLSPLKLGDKALGEFELTGAEVVSAALGGNTPRIIYTFGPSGLRVALEPRSSQPHFAQTASFNLLHQTQAGVSGLSAREGELLKQVAALVRANDPGGIVWKSAPTFFLVPGALGDQKDLSVNAVEVLRRVPLILVEEDKEAITSEILATHAIAAGDKRIVALPNDDAPAVRLFEEIVAGADDFCLFGADEGLPGFNDPGKALLAAAARLGDRVLVRTVAGPSALAMALLRVPINIDQFVFLGVLGDDPAGRVEKLVRGGEEKVVILFLTNDADLVARRLAELCAATNRELFLVCNLTCKDEMLFHLRPGDDLAALPILERQRTVLVVGPAPEAQPAQSAGGES